MNENKGINKESIQKEEENMNVYVKPIQATPTLSGKDARALIKEVLIPPSPDEITKLRERMEMRKRLESK